VHFMHNFKDQKLFPNIWLENMLLFWGQMNQQEFCLIYLFCFSIIWYNYRSNMLKFLNALFGCLYWETWHCIELNANIPRYWYWDWMSIFPFGCLDIHNPDLILRLNVKCCLDDQSDELQLYETLLIIPFNICMFSIQHLNILICIIT
jgi:hypothetical protein